MGQSFHQLIPFIKLLISTYRLTKLINEDYLLNDLRQIIWKKYPRDTKIGYLFTCPWCMSIWAAGGLILLAKISPDLYNDITLILTASAVTGILTEKL